MIRHTPLLITALLLTAAGTSCQKDPLDPDHTFDTIPWTQPADTTLPILDTTALYTLPKPCTMWNGHLVALVDSVSPREAYLTLISLRDWSHITSAVNTTTPTQAIDTAASYTEQNLAHWQIPSETLARQLKTTYAQASPNLAQLNALLAASAADTISLTTGTTKSRYLCQNATKTYSYCTGTNVTNAGATIKNYHLRLTRQIPLIR